MENEIILTAEGLQELKTELKNLIDNVRPQVIEELVEARAQGDLSENADYDAARNRQAEVEARIKELEAMVVKATVIEKDSVTNHDLVKVGSTVTFKNLNDKTEMIVKIVGQVEADPFENKISNESQLAKAMLGQKKGTTTDVREVRVPYKIQIINVE
ncbi:transcription elongation factor GreA [Spiroplasma endosymbiont of Labia minor]|uniref:transcription elongation factor GreA n=1 Tax=Spiroplasma endosymbiont of Labia minor TaxID=3066305 RepID=UPI0030D43FBF